MIDTSVLMTPVLPQPEMAKDWRDWAKNFTRTLQSQEGLYGLVDATRQTITKLQDDYISGDEFVTAAFEEAISVVTSDTSAVATRVTTLETQVQTPTTGLLARVTVTESTITTLNSSVASLSTTVSSHTTSIASNTADIATNTASIATNATAITTVSGSLSSLTTTVSALSTTVGGKVTSFRQTSAPTATAIGDIWIDSDDDNKIYRATATGSGSWVAVDDGRIATTASSLSGTQATVSTIQTALAGGGVSLALLAFQVNTGTNAASLKLISTSGGTWNGSAISLTATEISLNGNVIVNGTLTAAKLSISQLSSITTDLGAITAGSIRLTEDGYALHLDAGFGASDDLVLWYGLASVAAGSATTANCILCLATDGKVYYNGAELTQGTDSALYASVSYTGGADAPNVVIIANGDLPQAVDFTATVNVTGGTAPYTYYYEDVTNGGSFTLTYSDGEGSNTFEAAKTVTTPGSYSAGANVRVVDAAGAVAFAVITVLAIGSAP